MISPTPPMRGCIVALTALAVAASPGCGLHLPGKGSAGGGLDGTIGVLNAPILLVDLATGTVSSRRELPELGSDPAYKSGTMVFRRVVSPDGTFFLGVYEVTQGQWQALAGTTPWTALNTSLVGGAQPAPDMPAFALSHTGIETAVSDYGQAHGVRFAIPSQAQWDFACRAGSSTDYSWGDAGAHPDLAVARLHAVAFETATDTPRPQPVGSDEANALGFYDMQGNVWEWTRELDGDGLGTVRGGSWHDFIYDARNGNAVSLSPEDAHPLAGVRLVLIP